MAQDSSARPRLHVVYNSPVILTLTLAAFGATLAGALTNDMTTQLFFSLPPRMSWTNPLNWVRAITYVAGHANFQHFFGNISVILLVGPLLEEKHGSKRLLAMILATALVTAVANSLLFPTGLCGASGIVFMLILLSSFADIRQGALPLTFILVAVLFLGRELVDSLKADNVSQFAHIAGGMTGAAFGFRNGRGKRST